MECVLPRAGNRPAAARASCEQRHRQPAIRAEVIIAMLRGGEPGPGKNPRLVLRGAPITRHLDLGYARLEHPIILRECNLDDLSPSVKPGSAARTSTAAPSLDSRRRTWTSRVISGSGMCHVPASSISRARTSITTSSCRDAVPRPQRPGVTAPQRRRAPAVGQRHAPSAARRSGAATVAHNGPLCATFLRSMGHHVSSPGAGVTPFGS